MRWGERPIATEFLDLPQAAASAHAAGMAGPIASAMLRNWKSAGPVWQLVPARKRRNAPTICQVSGVTGEIIKGDISGYVASYNTQWDTAIKGLQQLVRQTMPGAATCGGLGFVMT